MSEEDDDGRTATNRQFVFLFDPEVFRETRASGLVWLEPDGPGEASDSKNTCCQTAVTSAVTSKEPGNGPVSVNGCEPGDSGSACDSNADHTKPDSVTGVSSPKRCSSPGAVTSMNENGNTARSERSVGFPPSEQVTAGLSAPVTADVQQHDCCHFPDPRAFAPAGAPERTECALCGRVPSFSREIARRAPALPVLLRPGRRARAPGMIDPSTMKRAGVAIGRCDVCGFEAARWHGEVRRLSKAATGGRCGEGSRPCEGSTFSIALPGTV